MPAVVVIGNFAGLLMDYCMIEERISSCFRFVRKKWHELARVLDSCEKSGKLACVLGCFKKVGKLACVSMEAWKLLKGKCLHKTRIGYWLLEGKESC